MDLRLELCNLCCKRLPAGELCSCPAAEYGRRNPPVPVVKQITVEEVVEKAGLRQVKEETKEKTLNLSDLKYPVWIVDNTTGHVHNCEDQDELESVIDACCKGPGRGCEILTVAYEITGTKKEYIVK